ncbi:hypothetical protein AVEN_104346-1 [Araneus ventricosus]|uniref:RNase H type-1 domain-containing protein n=1 Tax=Araneus ventricosus TaxID=182803 RepID=A0A4Y2BXB4_ARAVE|nr:hypothetical protein AVEN_104346-1 [Araneus ventricosus]
MGTGHSYRAFENFIKVLEWKGKLEKFHTVFQAELMELKEAIIRASQGNEISKIWTDSLSSAMYTPHQLVRDIQYLLTHITSKYSGRWIKAHVGYQGNNEEAYTFANKAITDGVVVKALKPRCELKQHLK